MMRKKAWGVVCSLFGGTAMLFLLSGCGVDPLEAAGVAKANPPGLYTDATLVDHLETGFYEAKSCANLENGDFTALTVVIMEPRFPCRWYAGGCSGEFVVPNTVKLGSPYVWKHEVLHYLLNVNTGDPDSSHTSDVFAECT